MKRWLILAGLLLSMVLAGSTACSQSGKAPTAQQPVKAVSGNLTISVSGSGTVEVSHEVDLSFGTSGRIARLLVKEGDDVSQGQVIAKLETDALELAMAQAKVAYVQAQLAVKQNDVAVSQSGVAITQAGINLKSAQIALEQTVKTSSLSDLRIAQADVDTAKSNLADSLIRLTAYAPGSVGFSEYQKNVVLAQARLKAAQFAGVITSLPVDEGDTVLPTTVISHLVEPGKMELKVQVDEIDIPGVKIGQRAIVKVDALPETPLVGKVSYIKPIPRKESGVTLFDVKIDLEATDGTGLRSGMSASADIVLNERTNVLLVPDRVVKQSSQGKTVVDVVVNGQSEERVVVTGISDGFQTEIISGLNEGEAVVGNRAQ